MTRTMMTKNCDECWWYWDNVAGTCKICHEPDACEVIKAKDTDCPWFTERAEKVNVVNDIFDEDDEWN